MTPLLEDGRTADLRSPGDQPPHRRRQWSVAVIAGALVALAVAVALIVHTLGRGDGEGDYSGARVDDAAFVPFVDDSTVTAIMWTEAMAEGDAMGAWLLMCQAGREKYPDPTDGRLLGDFERFLGGRLESAEVVDATVSDGYFYVTITGTLQSGDPVRFGAVVVSQETGMASCGYVHPSEVP